MMLFCRQMSAFMGGGGWGGGDGRKSEGQLTFSSMMGAGVLKPEAFCSFCQNGILMPPKTPVLDIF